MRTKEELRLYKRDWSRKRRGTNKSGLSKSTTWKGRRAEILILNKLDGGIDNNKGRLNREFDVLWNGKRLDVKSCNLYKRKMKRGKPANSSGWWVFNKNKGEADMYMCICMIDNIPDRYYLIPSGAFGNGISIGHKSKKFDKYLIIL